MNDIRILSDNRFNQKILGVIIITLNFYIKFHNDRFIFKVVFERERLLFSLLLCIEKKLNYIRNILKQKKNCLFLFIPEQNHISIT